MHSCVEILRYEMTDADQFTKWREEIREFMEPLATNAGRADFIEGLDGVVYEFPLQLYTHVAMPGRSKTTNYYYYYYLLFGKVVTSDIILCDKTIRTLKH